jgi:hypothetical protein
VLLLHVIAENRIQEAIDAGAFDNLPGAGRPLDLTEDPLVPAELRAAYRMLRNAGCVPPEVEQLRELRQLQRSVAEAPDADSRRRALAKLNLLSARLAESRGLRGYLRIEARYAQRVLERLGGGAKG